VFLFTRSLGNGSAIYIASSISFDFQAGSTWWPQDYYSMARPYHPDLRWRVVYFQMDGYSYKDIAMLLRISKATVRRILKLYQRWCCVENPLKGQPGRRKLFSGQQMEVLNVHAQFVFK